MLLPPTSSVALLALPGRITAGFRCKQYNEYVKKSFVREAERQVFETHLSIRAIRRLHLELLVHAYDVNIKYETLYFR